MELESLHRMRPVAHAHDDAIRRPRGDLELGGQPLARHRQRVVAAASNGEGRPSNEPMPAWWTGHALPCTGGTRITSAPYATPMAWWPRQTPRIGTDGPRRRTSSTLIPAFSGRDGPGEMTIASGPLSLDLLAR